jgi:predicted dehydrogenase
MNHRLFPIAAAVVFALSPSDRAGADDKVSTPLRAGLIGLDTSHVIAFTKLFNDPSAAGDVAALRIVAGFPGGTEIPDSKNRVGKFTEELRGMGIEICDSIPALLEKVDVVLLESVDGRPHLEQALPVLRAGKPLFIDKPLAGSLADAVAIAEAAKRRGVPWFSSSSLRFSPDIIGMRGENPKTGKVLGCDAWGPCPTEPSHPDLFWYGVHGVEILYTILGPGCERVSRTRTDGAEMVVGAWKDGRIGSFRGLRAGKSGYGATVFGDKGIAPAGDYAGYKPLCEAIGRFFKTRVPPVAPEETLELFAFMEAADESKRRGGAPVTIAEVLDKARAEALKRAGD